MSKLKKQLVFIHGGEAYSRESDYVLHLESQRVSEGNLTKSSTAKKRWHYLPALQQTMGDDWQVIRPDMPSDSNAKYAHWKIWFEKYISHLRDDVVLAGHSLGAMFLSRYLSENTLPVRVSKLFLFAGAFARDPDHQPGQEDGEYFYTHLDNFHRLSQSAREVILVHSRDDFVVPFGHLAMWREKLSSARVIEFENKGHFLQEEFPEIVDMIQGQ